MIEGDIGERKEDRRKCWVEKPHRKVLRTPTTEISSYSISKMNWRGHYWLLTIFWGTRTSNLLEALSATHLIYCNDFPLLAQGLQSRMNWGSNLLLVAVTLLKDWWFYQISVVTSATKTLVSIKAELLQASSHSLHTMSMLLSSILTVICFMPSDENKYFPKCHVYKNGKKERDIHH